MTEIERKAQELVNEVAQDVRYEPDDFEEERRDVFKALCRAIEQHEAFRQEVSDAVEAVLNSTYMPAPSEHKLRRFIINKPDPLEEIIKRNYAGSMSPPQIAYAIRKELDARGLEIREKSDG